MFREAFSTLGEKAEWRVKKSDGKEKPFALIVRFNVSENPDKPEKNTSYLVVVKISGESSCITDVVKPMAEAQSKKRVDLADCFGEKKPCEKQAVISFLMYLKKNARVYFRKI